MARVLTWHGIVLDGSTDRVGLLVLSLYFVGSQRLTRNYDVRPEAVVIPIDAPAIESGWRWASIVSGRPAPCRAAGRRNCHEQALAGVARGGFRYRRAHQPRPGER